MPATTQGLPKGIHKLRLTLGADGKRQLDLEAPPQVPNLPPPSQADVQAGLDPRGLGPPEPQYGSVLPLPPPQVPGGAENNAPHLPAPVVPDAGPQLPPPAQTAVAPVAQQAPAPSREDFAAALRPVKGQELVQNPRVATAMLEAQDEILNSPDLVAQLANWRARDVGRIEGIDTRRNVRLDQVASENINQLRAQFDPFVNSEIARLNDDYRNRRLTRDQYQQRVEVIAQLISQRGVAIEDILARRFGDGIRLSVGDATPSLNLADTDPANRGMEAARLQLGQDALAQRIRESEQMTPQEQLDQLALDEINATEDPAERRNLILSMQRRREAMTQQGQARVEATQQQVDIAQQNLALARDRFNQDQTEANRQAFLAAHNALGDLLGLSRPDPLSPVEPDTARALDPALYAYVTQMPPPMAPTQALAPLPASAGGGEDIDTLNARRLQLGILDEQVLAERDRLLRENPSLSDEQAIALAARSLIERAEGAR